MSDYETYRHPGDPDIRRLVVGRGFPPGVAGLIEQYTRPVEISIRRGPPHSPLKFDWSGRATTGYLDSGQQVAVRPQLNIGFVVGIATLVGFDSMRALSASFQGQDTAHAQSVSDKNPVLADLLPTAHQPGGHVWWKAKCGQFQSFLGVDAKSVAMFQLEVADLMRIWDHLSKDRTATLDVPRCSHCGDMGKKLLQCGRCRLVSYCSKDHQVAHWKEKHKNDC